MAQDSSRPSGGVPLAELVTLRAVIDAVPVFMVAVEGPDLQVVAVSGSVRALAERSEWLGVPLAEVYPELVVQGVLDLYTEVYRTGQPFTAPQWRLELAGPGGSEVAELVVHWTSVPWQWPDGSLRGVIGVAHDVTETVRTRERAEQEAIESGRRYAHARDLVSELQQALLPPSVPVLPRMDIAARYLVADAEQSAGGDWFDVRPLADGRVALAVGDVVGHGVGAAAVMSQLRAVLGDALETTTGPAAAVARLERFAGSLPGARSATVVVAVIDPGTGTLEYLTRGHPAPVLVDASGTGRQLLGTGGGPLGSGGGGSAQRSQLAEGDVVVLFSDGLVERADRSYTAGLDELARLAEAATVGQLWPTGTSPSAVERICTDAVELLTRRGFADDVTVLAASLQAPVPALRIRMDASPEELPLLRAQLREWLTALRPDPADQLAVELAVGEAVDNAVEHGFHHVPDGTIVLAVRLDPDGRVHVRIDDDGMWRPPALARSGRGRGLTLIGSVAEDLVVEGQPTGTVTFSRRVSRPVSTTPTRSASAGALPSGQHRYDSVVVGDPPVLRVRGPVDALAAERFRAELAGLAHGSGGPVTVDLTAVTHLTSTGVDALAEAVRSAREHLVVLVAPTGTPAAFVLDLVGLPRRSAVPLPGGESGTVDDR